MTGLSNSFSGGIFLGIGIFHLLPEAIEGFSGYFNEQGVTGFVTRIPIAYILIWVAFVMTLYIEKIAFDSHALLDHGHGTGEGKSGNDNEGEGKETEGEKAEEQDEEVFKNMVSTQGKVGSFLMEKNLALNKNTTVDKEKLKASQIGKSYLDKGDDDLGDVFEKVKVGKINQDSKNDTSDPEKGVATTMDSNQLEGKENKPKGPAMSSAITPYLLLLALCFHSLFEGIATGLQNNTKGTISLMVAILAHKWAAALTIGVSFTKSGTEKSTFLKMIFIFSINSPIGIGLGMILTTFPDWVVASFTSLSVGTFIYIGGAEVIVEEFAISRYKWVKFFMYLFGGAFMLGVTMWEVAGEGE
eukprot:CAMPEP_0170526374 /NCGR_PEP_ID=MMETSP0209-20121228/11806_1 /TAXON_ID=665100 ORGANISM="Litonotus pictus, Strain P1" /NCGR_SAMPLE_ID=MMETSP0209 /ASSEMBLY_ACC=CAM_ASM_000301 /LENGTH=356 /DNA_ID=CAMNT_0010816161 /DNA_START=111 /DNA_END=1181 /DNA_ORIENTATION=-